MQTITNQNASASALKLCALPDEGLGEDDRALRMSARLQVTLDIERMLEIFNVEANQLLNGVNLEYRHAGLKIEIGADAKGRNRCRYDLKILDTALGEVTIVRNSRFNGRELEAFEMLLGGLLFPLRNALQYRAALNAAHCDPLTGLGNRAGLENALCIETSRSRRSGKPMSMLMIDIDHFKSINDRYGHMTGDRVLAAVAGKLNQGNRDTDSIFRYGGEEFAMLLPEASLAEAGLVAERLRKAVAALVVEYEGYSIDARVSIGAASLRSGDADKLLRNADLALYRAKRLGRDRVCLELCDGVTQPVVA